jgi:hypothetical protein
MVNLGELTAAEVFLVRSLRFTSSSHEDSQRGDYQYRRMLSRKRLFATVIPLPSHQANFTGRRRQTGYN